MTTTTTRQREASPQDSIPKSNPSPDPIDPQVVTEEVERTSEIA
jgi:hypothetical protein